VSLNQVQVSGTKEYFEFSGFGFEVVLSLKGCFPHYAEHVIDPMTGKEVFVIADPHYRKSALIVNPRTEEVMWEFRVPGTLHGSNPHIAHIIPEDIPGLGDAGWIICGDRDTNFIVVDRDGNIQKTINQGGWPHDCLLNKYFNALYVTSYANPGYLRKIDFNGNIIWEVSENEYAKLSLIESGGHTQSYGGDLIAVKNRDFAFIEERKDSDGTRVWECPQEAENPKYGSWLPKPHSAFRLGFAEGDGNLTVVGFEASGGIAAVDKECRIRWGVGRAFFDTWDGTGYRGNAYGLLETTHVFPFLDGSIGFIDWRGRKCSQICKLKKIPEHQFTWYAWRDWDPGNTWSYLKMFDVINWSEVYLRFINKGDNMADIKIYTVTRGFVYSSDFPDVWKEYSFSVPAHEIVDFELPRNVAGFKIAGKRTFSNQGVSLSIELRLRR